MRKRKINPEYLRRITSSEIRDEKLDALVLANALREFSSNYLAGILTVSINGQANGFVNLKMPVVSYVIRLLCEEAVDEMVECTVNLGEKLVIETTYPAISNHELTANVVKIARFAGFKVDREGDILIFSANIETTAVLHIYAVSSDEILHWLVTTYNM